VVWDAALVSPVCLGAIWERALPWVCLDSRVVHPASFVHHADLTPGKALASQGLMDPAMVSPIFCGVAMNKNTPIPPKPTQRPQLPLISASNEGKYLDEHVWPTLELALEKLQNAMQYHIPKEVLDTYEGGHRGHAVQRVSYPGHAEEFDPLMWLSRYLTWFAPLFCSPPYL
jgi:hypothetical protein